MSHTPKCFNSSAEYDKWYWLAQVSKLVPSDVKEPAAYCTDCTTQYQAQMTVEGRCRFPETVVQEWAFDEVRA
jgi:hypothetical protein